MVYTFITSRLPLPDITFLSSGPSISSSKIKEYFNSYGSSLISNFRLVVKSGDGNIGSKTILNVLSINSGMIRDSRGLSVSKHGFVLASIKINLKSSSIMKSYPRISKEFVNLSGSSLKQVARIESVISVFICGTKCFRTSTSRSP